MLCFHCFRIFMEFLPIGYSSWDGWPWPIYSYHVLIVAHIWASGNFIACARWWTATGDIDTHVLLVTSDSFKKVNQPMNGHPLISQEVQSLVQDFFMGRWPWATGASVERHGGIFQPIADPWVSRRALSRDWIISQVIHIYKWYPIGSMYGIYANIGGILMVNVTIYSIHGSYGYMNDQSYGKLP
jgi:hypothetical protein